MTSSCLSGVMANSYRGQVFWEAGKIFSRPPKMGRILSAPLSKLAHQGNPPAKRGNPDGAERRPRVRWLGNGEPVQATAESNAAGEALSAVWRILRALPGGHNDRILPRGPPQSGRQRGHTRRRELGGMVFPLQLGPGSQGRPGHENAAEGLAARRAGPGRRADHADAGGNG